MPLGTLATLDFEDPFAEDEDEQPPHFSPDAIRQDVLRSRLAQLPTPEELESSTSDPNASISTFDINASPNDISPSTSQSSIEVSSQFSNVSLSADEPPTSSPYVQELTIPSQQNADDEDDATAHEYPHVVIDLEATPDHRVAERSSDELFPDNNPNSLSPHDLPPLTLNSKALASTSGSQIPTANSSRSSSTSVPPVPSSPTKPASTTNTSHSPLSEQQAAFQKKMGHRPTKSAGPSTFEKVRSRTRPVHLPPKNRAEDNKHLADWEAMMKLSRSAADKRRADLQKRRLDREKRIDESLHQWEKDIVPDWRVVHSNAALRRLWWRGIPTKLRASMWEKAVGNGLALSKESYRTCLARAKRALNAGTFPSGSLSLIEEDVSTTLPALHIFHRETGPMYGDLKEFLFAWVVARSDEGLGYTFGVARLAAMLLITMPAQQAFVVMRNLLERHCLRSFYGGSTSRDDVEAYYRIFDTLLADGMPKIYFNFKQHQISPASYLPDWIMPLFLDHLPFEACARVWDVIILEGDSFMYQAALGILAVLEPRLFFPDKKELLELLKGENKAAIEVASRDCVPLNGGKYEIYGVDEETLWERIEAMREWWKESTWKRLLTRELPDV